MRKLRWISIVLGVCLSLMLVGSFVFAAEKVTLKVLQNEIQADDLYLLPERVQENFSKSLRNDTVFYISALRLNAFQFTHPNIDFEPVGNVPRGKPYVYLITMIAQGNAPAWMYVAPCGIELSTWVNQGAIADITDYVKNWDKLEVATPYMQEAWYKGRCYAIPSYIIGRQSIKYRRDIFRDAGIFDEKGEPSAPLNWTWEDFLEIGRKVTNPKKKVWAFGISGGSLGFFVSTVYRLFPLQPDPTQKYTWRSAYDTEPYRKALELYKQIVFEDKIALTGVEAGKNIGSGFYTGRYVMERRDTCAFQYDAIRYKGQAGMLQPEDMGVLPYPKGNAGWQYVKPQVALWGMNATLNKEEKDAAWEWGKWAYAGEGVRLYLTYMLDFLGLDQDQLYNVGKLYGQLPDRMPNVYMPEYWKRTINYIDNQPVEPVFKLGMPRSDLESLFKSTVVEKVMINPEVDIPTLLKAAATAVNSGILNYKDGEITMGDIEKYFTDLRDFYKQNYPEYYEKVFAERFEKFYKVW